MPLKCPSSHGCILLARMQLVPASCVRHECWQSHALSMYKQVLPAEAQGRISILASRQDTTVPDVFAKSLKRRCSCQQRRALVIVHWPEHVLMCRGDVIVAACCPLAVSAPL